MIAASAERQRYLDEMSVSRADSSERGEKCRACCMPLTSCQYLRGRCSIFAEAYSFLQMRSSTVPFGSEGSHSGKTMIRGS
eukprot:scaffold37301_cov67-Phaeocystis_antarctica.AAC.2